MKELLSGLIGPVTGIINKVVPDKDEAARLAHETFITVECIPVRVKAFVGRLARMARAFALHSMRDYLNILSLIIKLFKT